MKMWDFETNNKSDRKILSKVPQIMYIALLHLVNTDNCNKS